MTQNKFTTYRMNFRLWSPTGDIFHSFRWSSLDSVQSIETHFPVFWSVWNHLRMFSHLCVQWKSSHMTLNEAHTSARYVTWNKNPNVNKFFFSLHIMGSAHWAQFPFCFLQVPLKSPDLPSFVHTSTNDHLESSKLKNAFETRIENSTLVVVCGLWYANPANDIRTWDAILLNFTHSDALFNTKLCRTNLILKGCFVNSWKLVTCLFSQQGAAYTLKNA